MSASINAATTSDNFMRQPPISEATGAFKSSSVNPTDFSNSNAFVSSATCLSTNLGREQTHLRTGFESCAGTTLVTPCDRDDADRRDDHRSCDAIAATSRSRFIEHAATTFKFYHADRTGLLIVGIFVRMRLDKNRTQIRI